MLNNSASNRRGLLSGALGRHFDEVDVFFYLGLRSFLPIGEALAFSSRSLLDARYSYISLYIYLVKEGRGAGHGHECKCHGVEKKTVSSKTTVSYIVRILVIVS